MSEVIFEFLNNKKLDWLKKTKSEWLKKQTTTEMDPEENLRIEQEGEEKYSLATWLPDAAKRAKQLSMTTHLSKYSHPSARSSSVIANSAKMQPDGYLRTGNVVYDLDVFGNAAALDVQGFLAIKLDDGKTILEHLEINSPKIQEAFAIADEGEFIKIRQGFLAIKKSDSSQITDGLVKQVYFPVDDNYHLLSLLSPSGLLSKVKATLDESRFGETTKQAKDHKKNGSLHPFGYDDFYDLTVIAYGGTKPQNIGMLNNKAGGRAYLLPSSPPPLKNRKITLPSKNFFTNSLIRSRFKDNFIRLHELMQTPINNMHVRQAIENVINYIIDNVLERAFMIRAFGEAWSTAEHYQKLPLDQRIWLDDLHKDQREKETDWIDSVAQSCTHWFIQSYEKTLKDNKIMTGEAEFSHIKEFVTQTIERDKGVFK